MHDAESKSKRDREQGEEKHQNTNKKKYSGQEINIQKTPMLHLKVHETRDQHDETWEKERKERKKPDEYDAIAVTDEWHARSVKEDEKKKERREKRKDTAQRTIVYTNKHEGSANTCPRIESSSRSEC